MNAAEINLEWVAEESAAEVFAAGARESGATVLETKRWVPEPENLDDYGDTAFEPLTAVALIVATGWLIRRIADVYDDIARPGGQLIEVRDDRVIVRPLPKAKPPGKLVVVSRQGTQVFPPERLDEGLALLGNLLGSSSGE